MKSDPGTYALVLRSSPGIEIEIGHWGRLLLVRGFYLYVGSAFGPGGVRARVSRHFRANKRNRWHIDYLRAATEPLGAWRSYASERLEHRWAQAFMQMEGVECIDGFGSSDCGCAGHLFSMPRLPGRDELAGVLGMSADFCDAVQPLPIRAMR